jgi:hypothetical protein
MQAHKIEDLESRSDIVRGSQGKTPARTFQLLTRIPHIRQSKYGFRVTVGGEPRAWIEKDRPQTLKK